MSQLKHRFFLILIFVAFTLTIMTHLNSSIYSRENLYATAPKALLHEEEGSTSTIPPPTNCTCVNCYEDTHCGGLWTGTAIGDRNDNHINEQERNFDKISIVVAHCNRDLSWLSNFTHGVHIHSTTIISKCQAEVEGAPQNSTIIRLENAGRCDHSYAYYITQMDHNVTGNEVVIFLKDIRDPANLHLKGYYRSLQSMLYIAAKTGFACGVKLRGNGYPPPRRKLSEYILHSAYADSRKLSEFRMGRYTRLQYGSVSVKQANFKNSKVTPMKKWLEAMSIDFPSNVTALCFGGTFAATRRNIQRQPLRVYQAIEQSLSRGDSIIENHFAERAWGGILSEPLPNFQIEALLAYKTIVSNNQGAFIGQLQRSVGNNKTKFDLDIGP
mmetsp:Transcript_27984/g.39349  ORF Transcript_27984/g.39349 Transcript_27984/m.39349 type:complete len:384 (+) Transcript_27984:204-1355(+)